jgi:hypothetical protein
MAIAHISKLGRCERKVKKEQVLKLARMLSTDLDELLTFGLSDLICELEKNEKMQYRHWKL